VVGAIGAVAKSAQAQSIGGVGCLLHLAQGLPQLPGLARAPTDSTCGVLVSTGGVHMSGRSQGASAVSRNVGPSETILFSPAQTFTIWEPFFAGVLKANAQAQEAFGMIAGEWQAFVAHRLQEDMDFVQCLAGSRTPKQILAAHTVFWQKAAQDYSKEVTAISKLLGKATSKVAQASQAAPDEASKDQWHWQRAAA